MTTPPVLLSVTDLKVHFPRPGRGLFAPAEVVKAVDGGVVRGAARHHARDRR